MWVTCHFYRKLNFPECFCKILFFQSFINGMYLKDIFYQFLLSIYLFMYVYRFRYCVFFGRFVFVSTVGFFEYFVNQLRFIINTSQIFILLVILDFRIYQNCTLHHPQSSDLVTLSLFSEVLTYPFFILLDSLFYPVYFWRRCLDCTFIVLGVLSS